MHSLLPQLQQAGLRAADLDRLFLENRPAPDFVETLVRICALGDPLPQTRALGLLLRSARHGAPLPPALIERLLDHVAPDTPGTAPLLLCQLLAALPPCPPDCALDFLVTASSHRRPFVRAWACSALHSLSRHRPEFRAEIAPILRRARRDPAPSVRARLRRAPTDATRARPSLLATAAPAPFPPHP